MFDDGRGPAAYLGGESSTAGGAQSRGITKWNGNAWSSVTGADGSVYSLTVANLGNGARVVAGGNFTSVGEVSAQRIASWNGTTWGALGTGVPGFGTAVHALAVHNFGGEAELCIGGRSDTVGGVTSRNLAHRNGTTCSSLTTAHVSTGTVYAIGEIDDGAGPTLFAGSEAAPGDANLIK